LSEEEQPQVWVQSVEREVLLASFQVLHSLLQPSLASAQVLQFLTIVVEAADSELLSFDSIEVSFGEEPAFVV
jgi:hypothetical protein